jgi:hypothetical protein
MATMQTDIIASLTARKNELQSTSLMTLSQLLRRDMNHYLLALASAVQPAGFSQEFTPAIFPSILPASSQDSAEVAMAQLLAEVDQLIAVANLNMGLVGNIQFWLKRRMNSSKQKDIESYREIIMSAIENALSSNHQLLTGRTFRFTSPAPVDNTHPVWPSPRGGGHSLYNQAK